MLLNKPTYYCRKEICHKKKKCKLYYVGKRIKKRFYVKIEEIRPKFPCEYFEPYERILY